MFSKLFKSMLALDKQAHFGWGGLICAFVTILCLLQDVSGVLCRHDVLYCIIGTVATAIFACLKDFVIDSRVDKLDIVASMLGCIPVWLAVVLGVILNIASH